MHKNTNLCKAKWLSSVTTHYIYYIYDLYDSWLICTLPKNTKNTCPHLHGSYRDPFFFDWHQSGLQPKATSLAPLVNASHVALYIITDYSASWYDLSVLNQHALRRFHPSCVNSWRSWKWHANQPGLDDWSGCGLMTQLSMCQNVCGGQGNIVRSLFRDWSVTTLLQIMKWSEALSFPVHPLSEYLQYGVLIWQNTGKYMHLIGLGLLACNYSYKVSTYYLHMKQDCKIKCYKIISLWVIKQDYIYEGKCDAETN